MSALSNYLEEAILNAIYRGLTYTSPAAVYVALYTTDPTDADVGAEVVGVGYSRKSAAFNAPVTSGDAKAITNLAEIVYDTAQGAWGTVTHIGVRDAETGGNLLHHGILTNPKTVAAGDVLKFQIGDLSLGLR